MLNELTKEEQLEIKRTMQSRGWNLIMERLSRIIIEEQDITKIDLKEANSVDKTALVFLATRKALNLITNWLNECLGEALAPQLQKELEKQAEAAQSELIEFKIKE
jgi:bifunctional pyridoxal-dependent enzyme with beta-cystathionase and maltose regulon repressor activities